jgi:hypothetical protein
MHGSHAVHRQKLQRHICTFHPLHRHIVTNLKGYCGTGTGPDIVIVGVGKKPTWKELRSVVEHLADDLTTFRKSLHASNIVG